MGGESLVEISHGLIEPNVVEVRLGTSSRGHSCGLLQEMRLVLVCRLL